MRGKLTRRHAKIHHQRQCVPYRRKNTKHFHEVQHPKQFELDCHFQDSTFQSEMKYSKNFRGVRQVTFQDVNLQRLTSRVHEFLKSII